MFKHLLWFTREPADEREAALFSKAYQRALVSLWFGLILLWILGAWVPISTEQWSGTLVDAVQLLLVVSILSGWSVMRKEELEYKVVTIKKNPPFWQVFLGLFLSLVLAWGLVRLHPTWFVAVVFAVLVGHYAWMATAAWQWLRPYALHARLLGALFFPLEALGFLAFHPASLGKRIFTMVLTLGAYVGSLLVAVFFTVGPLIVPVFVDTYVFEPMLKEGEYLLIDQTIRTYEEGDFVAIDRETEIGFRIGNVLRVDGANVFVRTAVGDETWLSDRIVGRVEITYPMKNVMNWLTRNSGS